MQQQGQLSSYCQKRQYSHCNPKQASAARAAGQRSPLAQRRETISSPFTPGITVIDSTRSSRQGAQEQEDNITRYHIYTFYISIQYASRIYITKDKFARAHCTRRPHRGRERESDSTPSHLSARR